MKTTGKFSLIALIAVMVISAFSCKEKPEPEPADKSELQAVITQADNLLFISTQGTEPGQYPPAAMTAFTNAINAAKAIMNDDEALQEAVDVAVTTLETAITTFTAAKIPVPIINKAALESAIGAATTLHQTAVVGFANGQYSQDAKSTFQAAIEDATVVKNNADATQAEVDAATAALTAAQTLFTSLANTRDYDEYLSLHLKMDGNISDESYYHHNGTLNVRSGAAVPQLTADRSGVAGKAYAFNGNNISIPNHSTLRPANVSISLWINPQSITGAQAVFSMNWWDGFYFKTEGDRMFFASTGAGGAYIGSVATVAVGAWYHVVMTRSNSEYRIYVNGELDNTAEIAANTGMTIHETQPFIIGALSYENDEYPFNGHIDEFRLYSKVLTADEVTAIFNQEKP